MFLYCSNRENLLTGFVDIFKDIFYRFLRGPNPIDLEGKEKNKIKSGLLPFSTN